jgi:hypothetical protein
MTLSQRNQTKGARSGSSGSSAGSWVPELCLGKEKAGASKVFKKNFDNWINRKFVSLQKFVGQDT